MTFSYILNAPLENLSKIPLMNAAIYQQQTWLIYVVEQLKTGYPFLL